MEEKFDPKNHTVLGYWPDANYACLMLNQARDFPFVAAYGYDPETKEWSQGHYFATATESWNLADPRIIASLSVPVSVRDVIEDMHDAGFGQVEDTADYRDVLEDFVADAIRCTVPNDDFAYESENTSIRLWFEWKHPEVEAV